MRDDGPEDFDGVGVLVAIIAVIVILAFVNAIAAVVLR
jgi:hypothetical protein